MHTHNVESLARGTPVFSVAALMMCQPLVFIYIQSNQEAVRQQFMFTPGLGRMGAKQTESSYGPCEPGFISQMLTNMEQNHNWSHTDIVTFLFLSCYSLSAIFSYSELWGIRQLDRQFMTINIKALYVYLSFSSFLFSHNCFMCILFALSITL